MNNDLIAYAVVGLAAILLVVWITREIFSIPAILRNQKAIIKLLALNAKKDGTPSEDVDAIVNEADKKENK